MSPRFCFGLVNMLFHTNFYQKSGKALYSDVVQLRDGGIERLVEYMQQKSTVEAVQCSSSSTKQRYILPRPDIWLRTGFNKLTALIRGSTGSAAFLPCNNPSTSTTVTTSPNVNPITDGTMPSSAPVGRSWKRARRKQPSCKHLHRKRP
jgi:hypothetical protein